MNAGKNYAKGLLLSFFIYIYLVSFVELCVIAELWNQPLVASYN